MASTSQKSIFMAWFNISDTPDCFEMITGTSDCMASSGAIPNGSDTDGITYTLLMAYILYTSLPFRNPAK